MISYRKGFLKFKLHLVEMLQELGSLVDFGQLLEHLVDALFFLVGLRWLGWDER